MQDFKFCNLREDRLNLIDLNICGIRVAYQSYNFEGLELLIGLPFFDGVKKDNVRCSEGARPASGQGLNMSVF